MILDRITDWIVTAWEFIGLLFLSGGTDPTVLGRWNPGGGSEADDSDAASVRPAAARRAMQQLHFV